jgi:putative spermidine/putrescine transport system ATP-binding protein/spermidine/putrescine transport system ATP-binding protein
VTFVFVTHAQSEALALSDRIVVMNAGRIEQISAPYELYTRPKTLFVAKFIGRNALIAGTVAAADEGGARLDTSFGSLSAAVEGPRPQVGAAASLAVPAEAIDVLPASTSAEALAATYGGAGLRATVAGVSQVGHILQILAEIGAASPVLIESHADKYSGRFATGDAVWLAWRRQAATLVAH